VELFAHSENASGRRQPLDEHLHNVAELAARFGRKFGAGEFARLVGLCHDVGKSAPEWQRYLAEGGRSKVDHRLAGALLAAEHGPDLLAFAVLGHHGGLPDRAKLKDKIAHARKEVPRSLLEAYRQSIAIDTALPGFLRSGHEKRDRRAVEFFIRMLFSALVDADYLDTELHFKLSQSARRTRPHDLHELYRKLVQNQETLQKAGRVNAARNRIYRAALKRAPDEQGFFSLTVPTGGGKTRTGMAFALKHALHHALDRVIVVIPYTSIIEQTADEYRRIFGADFVVEHHSALDPGKEPEWNRLAAENWDAPIVVTTSVQFFDSLHSNLPSACRKLHSVARSVVILDEVQTLPPGLLAPALDVIRELADNYGASFVFSTATQPAFRSRPGFEGLANVREIVPDALSFFEQFKRVQYEIAHPGEEVAWEDIAAELRSQKQVLAVVNTKADAQNLFQLVAGPDAFHLSTNLCPDHRRAELAKVKRRLAEGRPCRLVSTQVVETGVDFDFPMVFRAFGPLDSIVQCGGRCNREGKKETGRVVVFRPSEGGMPAGAYRRATDVTASMSGNIKDDNLQSPALFDEYFRILYGVSNLDEKSVCSKREAFSFEQTTEAFRLIPCRTVPVVVPYRGQAAVVSKAAAGNHLGREDFRRIQNHSVSLWPHQLDEALSRGLCREVRPGLYQWLGGYEEKLGIVMEGLAPEKFIL